MNREANPPEAAPDAEATPARQRPGPLTRLARLILVCLLRRLPLIGWNTRNWQELSAGTRPLPADLQRRGWRLARAGLFVHPEAGAVLVTWNGDAQWPMLSQQRFGSWTWTPWPQLALSPQGLLRGALELAQRQPIPVLDMSAAPWTLSDLEAPSLQDGPTEDGPTEDWTPRLTAWADALWLQGEVQASVVGHELTLIRPNGQQARLRLPGPGPWDLTFCAARTELTVWQQASNERHQDDPARFRSPPEDPHVNPEQTPGQATDQTMDQIPDQTPRKIPLRARLLLGQLRRVYRAPAWLMPLRLLELVGLMTPELLSSWWRGAGGPRERLHWRVMEERRWQALMQGDRPLPPGLSPEWVWTGPSTFARRSGVRVQVTLTPHSVTCSWENGTCGFGRLGLLMDLRAERGPQALLGADDLLRLSLTRVMATITRAAARADRGASTIL